MAGRPRKPKNSKVLEGTFRKDRDNPNAPRPLARIPAAPDWLPDEARARWDKVVARLGSLGIVGDVDEDDLAAYCVLYAKFIECARSGELLSSNYIAQMRGYSTAFGMNPAGREKLTVREPVEEKKSKWAP